jgi:nitrite reductase (cytochrome c-552)
VRSPLLNINRACQSCHRVAEDELKARVEKIQITNHGLLQRGGKAIVELIDAIVAAKAAGASDEQLHTARQMQRKAQWRLDYIAAENSMGFHAPQEAARILAEAIDYARQGQLATLARGTGATPPPTSDDASKTDTEAPATAPSDPDALNREPPAASTVAPSPLPPVPGVNSAPK